MIFDKNEMKKKGDQFKITWFRLTTGEEGQETCIVDSVEGNTVKATSKSVNKPEMLAVTQNGFVFVFDGKFCNALSKGRNNVQVECVHEVVNRDPHSNSVPKIGSKYLGLCLRNDLVVKMVDEMSCKNCSAIL